MEEKRTIIEVKDLEKAYKLYDKPSDRLKEALGLGRKKRYKEHYALKGVDLNVFQGIQIFTLYGSSISPDTFQII